jgi:hypothetical protein
MCDRLPRRAAPSSQRCAWLPLPVCVSLDLLCKPLCKPRRSGAVDVLHLFGPLCHIVHVLHTLKLRRACKDARHSKGARSVPAAAPHAARRLQYDCQARGGTSGWQAHSVQRSTATMNPRKHSARCSTHDAAMSSSMAPPPAAAARQTDPSTAVARALLRCATLRSSTRQARARRCPHCPRDAAPPVQRAQRAARVMRGTCRGWRCPCRARGTRAG